MAHFYYKSTCSTCRKARSLLQTLGVQVEDRDMSRNPLSAPEISELIGDREIRPFLNSRNEMYRELKLGANIPEREEGIRLMAQNPNLIRRPLLVENDLILFGFDPEAYTRFCKGTE